MCCFVIQSPKQYHNKETITHPIATFNIIKLISLDFFIDNNYINIIYINKIEND